MRKTVSKCAIAAVVAIGLGVLGGPASAEFTVKQVRTRLVDNKVLVSADLDLNLSEEAESAVENGVPLVVLTEFNLVRVGTFWDETLTFYHTRARLHYHALSNYYVVEISGAEGIETYRSVADALKRMGTLREVEVDMPASEGIRSDTLKLAVRSRLDISELPPPLRPLAFFSPAWRLSSDWTQWQITP